MAAPPSKNVGAPDVAYVAIPGPATGGAVKGAPGTPMDYSPTFPGGKS